MHTGIIKNLAPKAKISMGWQEHNYAPRPDCNTPASNPTKGTLGAVTDSATSDRAAPTSPSSVRPGQGVP